MIVEKKPKRTHARRTCKMCKERKARCELPDIEVQVLNEQDALPNGKKCHRCKTLQIDCFVQPLDHFASKSKRQKVQENGEEEEEEEDECDQEEAPPKIIHTFDLPSEMSTPASDQADPSSRQRNGSSSTSSTTRVTTSTSSSQSLDLMGRPFATFAWLVDARTQRQKSKAQMRGQIRSALQIIDKIKVDQLSKRLESVSLLNVGLPSHENLRRQAQIYPTPPRKFLLAVFYLYALLLRCPKLPSTYLDQEIAQDIQALGETIVDRYREVFSHFPKDLATAQAFNLLSTLDPLGLLLATKDKSSKPSKSTCHGPILLAEAAMQGKASHPNGIALQSCIDLNKTLLMIDDRLIAPYTQPDRLEQVKIDTLKDGMTLLPERENGIIHSLGHSLLQYRLAVFTVYIRTVQFLGEKVKECQECIRTGNMVNQSWIDSMQTKLLEADEDMRELQQSCLESMMENGGTMRLIAEEMGKLCLMEYCNVRGCLHVFYLRSIVWPFLSTDDISPFASYEVARDSYYDSDADEQAKKHIRRQQRAVEMFLEFADGKSFPPEIPSEFAGKIGQELVSSGSVRFEAAQETLATFIDCMGKGDNDHKPFGWAPVSLICNPVVEASKILMEVQISAISKLNKEAKQSPIWSLLMRKAADELCKLDKRTVNDDQGGGINDLLSLPKLSSEIVRDMDSVAMRAKQVLQQRKMQSRISIHQREKKVNERVSFPVSQQNTQMALDSGVPPPNDITLSMPVNIDELFQDLGQFWSQDPLDQLFVAWNQGPST